MIIVIKNPGQNTLGLPDRPTPPPSLMEFMESADAHLSGGRSAYEGMKLASREFGVECDQADRMLDFGCANGRITRWLPNADRREIWGCDIQADKVFWASENLEPLHFFVNDAHPHLPFEDGYFDFIFALSIFTHIHALHVSWMLELCRVLSRRGHLFVTLHDHETLDERLTPRASILRGKHFKGFETLVPNLDEVGFLSMNPYADGALAQVYMSAEYLQRILPPWMSIIGRKPRVYSDLQTGYILRRSL